MTIAEARQKCKRFIAARIPDMHGIPRDTLIIGVLVLSASLSFALGYLAGHDSKGNPSISVQEAISDDSTTAVAAETPSAGKFVASKNGTKYYAPSCAGASRISNANKVWFASAEAAASAGYSPAANCKGI